MLLANFKILAEVDTDLKNNDEVSITHLVATQAIHHDMAILMICIAISFHRNLMRTIFLSESSHGHTPRISA